MKVKEPDPLDAEILAKLKSGDVDPKYVRRKKPDDGFDYVGVGYPYVSTNDDGDPEPRNHIVYYRRKRGEKGPFEHLGETTQ